MGLHRQTTARSIYQHEHRAIRLLDNRSDKSQSIEFRLLRPSVGPTADHSDSLSAIGAADGVLAGKSETEGAYISSSQNVTPHADHIRGAAAGY